jgi:hypothetical protein
MLVFRGVHFTIESRLLFELKDVVLWSSWKQENLCTMFLCIGSCFEMRQRLLQAKKVQLKKYHISARVMETGNFTEHRFISL